MSASLNLQEVLAKEAEENEPQFSPVPSHSETFNNSNNYSNM